MIEKYFTSLIFLIILFLISFPLKLSTHFVCYVQDNDYEFYHVEYGVRVPTLHDQTLQSSQLDFKSYHYSLDISFFSSKKLNYFCE